MDESIAKRHARQGWEQFVSARESSPPPAESVRTLHGVPLCEHCGRALSGRRGARHCSARCRAAHHRTRRHDALVAELARLERVLAELAATVGRLRAVAEGLRPKKERGRQALAADAEEKEEGRAE